ncbi:radical SAM protein [Patescibacteria group bacterium]|nr:radical SAM protein [Patescibacteria group bacterium]
MKIFISYPPLKSNKGTPLLSQNRQFQWFNNPTYIYPMVPASAATLLEQNGHQVIWNDCIAENWSYSQFIDFFKQELPEVIVIETKTPVIKRHWQIINELKDINSNCKTVLVGDHVTALPEESIKNSQVDFVITGGDYDFLLVDLCNALQELIQTNQQHRSKNQLQLSEMLELGIWYRENNKIKNTGSFKLNHNLNSLPFIDRDLTKWKLYSECNGNYIRLPGTYTMVGRDCWYHKCTFCSWTTLYPRFRVRKPELLLDEIEMLVFNYGVKEIMDDTGTFPVGKWMRAFCKGMIERGLNRKVFIDCNMRFGALSLEDYKLMKKAGFRLILFGLESANQKTLEKISKSLTTEEIINSCKNAKKAGLAPHLTIMFGYPWEDYNDVMRTIKLGKYLMKKGYAHTLQATLVIPYPGTPLFEECRRANLLKTLDWDRYDMRELVMKVPIEEKKLMQAIQQLYKIALDPEFLLRRILSIRSFYDIKFFTRAAKAVMGHIRDFNN